MGREPPSHFSLTPQRVCLMDPKRWERALAGIDLGPRHYYQQVGSTNDIAEQKINQGSPDLTVIIADEQVAGRGRQGRMWHTPPDAALAFSVVILPQAGIVHKGNLSRLTGLGALAVAQALQDSFSIRACIKWPNDVLVEDKKACGVLVESIWKGDQLQGAILGMGININPRALPDPDGLRFPAISLEEAVDQALAREDVLAAVLKTMVDWYPRLDSDAFLQAWEDRLCWRGQDVILSVADAPQCQGRILGLDPDGSLRLSDPSGKVVSFQIGEIQLRPVDRS